MKTQKFSSRFVSNLSKSPELKESSKTKESLETKEPPDKSLTLTIMLGLLIITFILYFIITCS